MTAVIQPSLGKRGYWRSWTGKKELRQSFLEKRQETLWGWPTQDHQKPEREGGRVPLPAGLLLQRLGTNLIQRYGTSGKQETSPRPLQRPLVALANVKRAEEKAQQNWVALQHHQPSSERRQRWPKWARVPRPEKQLHEEEELERWPMGAWVRWPCFACARQPSRESPPSG